MICPRCQGAELNGQNPSAWTNKSKCLHLKRRLRNIDRNANSEARGPSQGVCRRMILPLVLGPLTLSLAEGAQASKLGPGVDRVWEGVGGGPADLFYPESFVGTWDVASNLINVELPLGPEFVPDMKAVDRSRTEMGKTTVYSMRFFESKRNKVITDRQFNTTSLIEMYYGTIPEVTDSIEWDPRDPNVLSLNLPDKTSVYTRVTRRSSNKPAEDRLETSEYFEMVFDNSAYRTPKVTASQCFTKYKWRSKEEAQRDGGPTIIATQVVSDYLTTSAGEQLMMESKGRPVVIRTYRMAFNEHSPAAIS